MAATPIEELGRRIEQVIREHLAASEREAADAIARAFRTATRGGRPEKEAPERDRPRRRPSAEITALGERLYQAVCAKPGETMTVLAGDLGASARQLNRPMTQLKRLGRIRGIGQRHQTRYFPLPAKS
jgi:hypothetical protein